MAGKHNLVMIALISYIIYSPHNLVINDYIYSQHNLVKIALFSYTYSPHNLVRIVLII